MTLELGSFPVSDVVFGETTSWRDGVLTIDASELRARLLPNPYFLDVSVDLVKPGDSARVHNIADIVEPRIRVSAPGTDFPGLLAPPVPVGVGRTHRLAGVAVCELSEPVPGEPVYWRQALFDASGPAAAYSPFGALNNVALTFKANPNRFTSETGEEAHDVFSGTAEAAAYTDAVRKAGLSTAVYLAATVAQQEPEDLARYDTSPVNHQSGLPRVLYYYQGAPYVYGAMMRTWSGAQQGSLPNLIHPNEILDGAVVNAWLWAANLRDVTYLIQNHPVIEELYAQHGRGLEFAGVVIYDCADETSGKDRVSTWGARMASLLEADAAILTHLGAGHLIVDVMMTLAKLEKQGVKTVLLIPEMAADPKESGLVDFVPEAQAIVSTGNYEAPINLPAVSRVLGGDVLLETGEDAAGPLAVTLRSVLGSTDPLGFAALRGIEW